MLIWRLVSALLVLSMVQTQSDKQDRNSKLIQLRKIATTGKFVFELDQKTYK